MATIVMISKEKMSANNFFFKDAESNTSGLLNRGRFSRFNLKSIMALFYGGVQMSQDFRAIKTAYFLPLSSQGFLILI